MTPDAARSSCCSTEAQETCCEPSAKSACCGTNAEGRSCGCSAGVVISNRVINLAADEQRVLDDATRADMAAYTGCIAGALTEAEFRGALSAAGFGEVEIRPTHRVHEHAGAAIIRARRAG